VALEIWFEYCTGGDILRAPRPGHFSINLRAIATSYLLPRVIYTTLIVQKSVEAVGCHGRATSVPVDDGVRRVRFLSK